MMKIFLIMILLMSCGCQIQINLASSVVNIPVTKTQLSEGNQTMQSEHKLKDLSAAPSNSTDVTGLP